MRTTSAQDALNHAFDSCAMFDRSDLGRLLGTGPDLLDLIHRLSTGEMRDIVQGKGRPTVLTTPKGRIVELLFVQHLGERGVLLVGGHGCAPRVAAHLERYVFAEQIDLRDVTAETYQFVLIGPAAAQVLTGCGVEPPAPYLATAATIGGKSTHLLGQDGFDSAGVSVTGPIGDEAEVRLALHEAVTGAGGSFASPEVLECYRILRGLPASGHELTEEHNPLEAGLQEAVSFSKGCYVGQEVVARLQTYDKVSRAIVGLELAAGSPLPQVGTALLHDGRTVGVLTSIAIPPGTERAVALGYLKRKELQPGLTLQVGQDGPTAGVVELPFARRDAE